jgi:hypothetical protein
MGFFYEIFFCLNFVFYTFCLIDRFKRIQMILPKSTANYLLIAIKMLICIIYLTIVGGAGTSTAINMFHLSVDAADWERLKAIVSILEGLLPVLIIVLEVYFNITLIITSLRSMSKDIKSKPVRNGDGPDAKINTTNQFLVSPAKKLLLFKIKEYRKLKFKMITMFVALALLDALTFAMAGIGTVAGNIIPYIETMLIISSICGLHIFVSFGLLDLFLVELNRIKRLTSAPKSLMEKIPLEHLHIDFATNDSDLPPSIKESSAMNSILKASLSDHSDNHYSYRNSYIPFSPEADSKESRNLPRSIHTTTTPLSARIG